MAVGGKLLYDDDPVARVRWEAITRKIYFDELPRITRSIAMPTATRAIVSIIGAVRKSM